MIREWMKQLTRNPFGRNGNIEIFKIIWCNISC